MLIHITPTLLCCEKTGWDCELMDVVIPEASLHLVAGKDVRAGRPWPNKNYLVATPKSARKAFRGIIFETPAPMDAFTVTTRWAINADYVLDHVVRYEIPDQDFDAATDSMVMWEGERMNAYHEGSPMICKPIAYLSFGRKRERKTIDSFNVRGQLVRIADHFVMPTISRSSIDPEHAETTQRLSTIIRANCTPPMATRFQAETAS